VSLAKTGEIPFHSGGSIVQGNINDTFCALAAAALSIFLCSCENRSTAVSGTIEVDEVHVGPRSGGRVEKIFAQEGERLHENQPIVQLAASELLARRRLAAAQIDTAMRDADAQAAQLEFLRADARRLQDVWK
jgi:multidrug efflux pump subunit AcrA (membrane-fusion protein)